MVFRILGSRRGRCHTKRPRREEQRPPPSVASFLRVTDSLCLACRVRDVRKMLSSTIEQKLSILFCNFWTRSSLQNMTPFLDFSRRKSMSTHHLRQSCCRETDAKVIKIRKSFVAPNSLPLSGLQRKNFRRLFVNRYDMLSGSPQATSGRWSALPGVQHDAPTKQIHRSSASRYDGPAPRSCGTVSWPCGAVPG